MLMVKSRTDETRPDVEGDAVNATELAIVLVAVIIGSIAKSVTGMGLPLIVIPIASLFVAVNDTVVVIALPNVLANAVLAGRERTATTRTRDLPVLAAVGVVGAVAGTLLLVNVSETPLVVAVVVAIVGYIVLFFAHPEFRTTPAQSKRLAPAVAALPARSRAPSGFPARSSGPGTTVIDSPAAPTSCR